MAIQVRWEGTGVAERARCMPWSMQRGTLYQGIALHEWDIAVLRANADHEIRTDLVSLEIPRHLDCPQPSASRIEHVPPRGERIRPEAVLLHPEVVARVHEKG